MFLAGGGLVGMERNRCDPKAEPQGERAPKAQNRPREQTKPKSATKNHPPGKGGARLRDAWATLARRRTRSNEATPLSSQATASPSMMQERERRRANVSTISGKRRVRSLPGRL